MPMILVSWPVLIHHIHADRSVPWGSSPWMTRLNGVVTIELFTRTGVGVNVAVVKVSLVVQFVLSQMSPVCAVWICAIFAVAGRMMLDHGPWILTTGVARIVIAVHSMMAVSVV